MADKPNLMLGRESWIFLELCLCLFAHFRGGGCKSVPSWCHWAAVNGHRQAGQGHDHRAGSNIFFNKSKRGRRLNEGEGCLYDDILGPLRLLGLLLLSSVKPGLHPEHFVCFGNEDFKGNLWGQVSSANAMYKKRSLKPGLLRAPPTLALIQEST